MIKGIIMDIDGTILDSMGIWDSAGERFLKSLGKTAAPGLRDILYPMTLQESADYLRREYDLSLSPQEIIDRILGIIRTFYLYEVCLKPTAKVLLEAIRTLELPMAAATTSDRNLILPALDRLGISSDFQDILTCSDIPQGKHTPLVYQKAASLLSKGQPVAPSDYLVVEDTFYCLETAKNAGFRTAAVFDLSAAADWDKSRKLADFILTEGDTLTGIQDKVSAL